MIAASTICPRPPLGPPARVRRARGSNYLPNERQARQQHLGQGGLSRTSPDRQYTPIITREEKRLCRVFFDRAPESPRGAADGRR